MNEHVQSKKDNKRTTAFNNFSIHTYGGLAAPTQTFENNAFFSNQALLKIVALSLTFTNPLIEHSVI